MNTSSMLIAVVLVLGPAGIAAGRDLAVPGMTLVQVEPAPVENPAAGGALPELPRGMEAMEARLRELSVKDPGAFRDLLRRSLSARLIRAARGEPLPADFPVELAGHLEPGR